MKEHVMKFPWIVIAALMGASGVALGAIGAHVVAGDDTAQKYQNLAFNYQMFHIAALVAVSYILSSNSRGRTFANIAGILITAGVILFSGSLYYLGWTGESLGFNLTPAGGMCLIFGWLFLAIGGFQDWRQKSSN